MELVICEILTIQKSVSLAKFVYDSIVERTLNMRHTRTSINLKQNKFLKLFTSTNKIYSSNFYVYFQKNWKFLFMMTAKFTHKVIFGRLREIEYLFS